MKKTKKEEKKLLKAQKKEIRMEEKENRKKEKKRKREEREREREERERAYNKEEMERIRKKISAKYEDASNEEILLYQNEEILELLKDINYELSCLNSIDVNVN